MFFTSTVYNRRRVVPRLRSDIYIFGSGAALCGTILFNNNMFGRTPVPHTPVHPPTIRTANLDRMSEPIATAVRAPTGWTSSSPGSVFRRDTSGSGRRPLYGIARAKDKTPFVFRPESRYAVAAALQHNGALDTALGDKQKFTFYHT